MALTEQEIEERIKILEESMDGVSEVSFDGETTKYRSIAEIEKALSRLYRMKKQLTKPHGRYRSYVRTVSRGL